MKDEVQEKFNEMLSIQIIRNMEAFLLHYIIAHLKE